MLLVARFLFFFVICGFVKAQVTINEIDLRVNHFNPQDRRSYSARYFVNNEFWSRGGPIFIHLSGFGYSQYGSELLSHGPVYEIARETNGQLFSLETRFFGFSRPTEDTSLENLRYLSLHQILADLALFIGYIRNNYNGASNSRVVLFGNHHGGTLAVWMRQKYPHLVDAVWASSAYINTVIEFPQAMSHTFATINAIGGSECGQILTDAFANMEDSVNLRNTTYIEQRLRLCWPVNIDDDQDIARLFWGVAEPIVYRFLSNALYTDIHEMCDIITSTEVPPENALDAFARWYIDDFFGNVECFNVNNTDIVSSLQHIEWDSVSTINGARQAFWLVCSQIGQWSIANDGIGHPFGRRFDTNFVRQWCAEAFDSESLTLEFFMRSISNSEVSFGGLNPGVERVFFTHGELDPSRDKGPTNDLNPNAPVVVMSGQPSGRDIIAPSDTDDDILLETRARARDLILRWISA